MRCLLLLLAFSTLSFAGDELCPELQWKLDNTGRILVWPHPSLGLTSNGESDAKPFMESGPGLFTRGFRLTGMIGLILGALPGTADLASIGNGAYQFQKLNMPVTKTKVIERIAALPKGEGPLLRRAQLDRILAVRMAGARHIEDALPALARLTKETDDPFLRRAASEALHDLLGQPSPALKIAALPTDIPPSADILLCFVQTRVPRWTQLWDLAKHSGVLAVRKILAQAGVKGRRPELARGQMGADTVLILGYEIARQFGNMRRHWTVIAARLPNGVDGPAIWSESDGLFEPALVHAALEKNNVVSEFKDGVCKFSVLGTGVEVRRTRVSVRLGTFPPTDRPAPKIPLGHAAWAFIRLSEATRPLIPQGIASGVNEATLTIDLERGYVMRLQAEYATEGRATEGLSAMQRTYKMLASESVLKCIDSGRADTTISLTLDLGMGLEQYLEAYNKQVEAELAGE